MTMYQANASAVLGSTYINSVTVSSAVSVSVTYTAIAALSNAVIGIWSGFQATGTPITTQPATAVSGTVTLTAQGYNFNNGPYTIAYVLNNSISTATSTICATVLISNGQYVASEMTSLIVTNQANNQGQTQLTILYSTPNGNTPGTNADWICLFAGSQVVTPVTPNLGQVNIASNINAGLVTLSTPSPLTYGQTYIIEYNPGHALNTVSAFYTFTFTAS